jgi:hypothetical protein
MVPTLFGRIQTRVVLLAVIGALWTAVITPFVPTGAPLDQSYSAAFVILLFVLAIGVCWEFIYHLLQQFRWEKDWPTSFGLLTGLPEGALLWWLIVIGAVPAGDAIPLAAFVVQFVSTWLVVWLITNGPIKIFFIRWRFRGGRFW